MLLCPVFPYSVQHRILYAVVERNYLLFDLEVEITALMQFVYLRLRIGKTL